MNTQDVLQQTVAEFFGTQPEKVGPDFPIAGERIEGSIGRALLMAAISRRTGSPSPGVVRTARTYGEIAAAMLGEPPPRAAATPNPTAAAPRAIGNGRPASGSRRAATNCGVDIEMVDNLPDAADYWEHPFYSTNFSREEIAYCLMKDSPRMHLCARWCAKEALRKCDPAFLDEPMAKIEIVADEAGAVLLRHHGHNQAQDLPHALSLSHTPQVAVAVVIAPGGSPEMPTHDATVHHPARTAPQAAAETSASPLTADRSHRSINWAPWCMSLIALLIAIAALLRSF